MPKRTYKLNRASGSYAGPSGHSLHMHSYGYTLSAATMEGEKKPSALQQWEMPLKRKRTSGRVTQEACQPGAGYVPDPVISNRTSAVLI